MVKKKISSKTNVSKNKKTNVSKNKKTNVSKNKKTNVSKNNKSKKVTFKTKPIKNKKLTNKKLLNYVVIGLIILLIVLEIVYYQNTFAKSNFKNVDDLDVYNSDANQQNNLDVNSEITDDNSNIKQENVLDDDFVINVKDVKPYEPVKTGMVKGAICDKNLHYNEIITTDDSKELICTIDLDSDYLFSWQIYTEGMENIVSELFPEDSCGEKFLDAEITEFNECFRKQHEDQIAVDEIQEDVFLICKRAYGSYYEWEKYE